MLRFKEYLTEGPLPLDQVSTKVGKKEVAVVQGRFQPPTLGHLKMIKQVYQKTHKPVLIAMVKGSKSKVFFDTKVQQEIWTKMLTGIPHEFVEVGTGFIGDWIDAARKKGLEPIALAAGSDRKKGYEDQINRYKEQLKLNMKFVEIPRTDEDISASKVRKALEDGDEKTFKQMMHKSTHSMFDKLRKLV